MSRNQRITLLGLAAVVLVVAFVVARGSSDDDDSDSTAAQTTATQPASADTAPQETATTTTTTEREPEPQVPTVVVRDAEPVGGVKELKFKSGEQIAFDVRSDQSAEVHVHGYDVEKTVPGGGTARFRMKGDLEGIFEVELHGVGVPIAELQVSP